MPQIWPPSFNIEQVQGYVLDCGNDFCASTAEKGCVLGNYIDTDLLSVNNIIISINYS